MNPLIRNRNMVDALASAVRGGSESLGQVPGLLCRVIEEEAWRHFTTALGKDVEHERLADFITTPPLNGLGASVELVQKIIADDTKALDLLDRALQKASGGDKRSEAARINVSNIHSDSARPSGTTKVLALRKLRKEADSGNEQAAELHAEVLAERISPHAAMIQAGFRDKTISVPVSKPERMAAYLRKHMSRESLTRLVELLTREDSQ
jgi:hypothetical protein